MTTIAASGPMWTDGLLWVDGVLHGHEDISRHMSWRWGTAFCLSMASQKGKGRLQVKVEEVPASDSENSCEVINLHHHKNENSIQMQAEHVASFFSHIRLVCFRDVAFKLHLQTTYIGEMGGFSKWTLGNAIQKIRWIWG